MEKFCDVSSMGKDGTYSLILPAVWKLDKVPEACNYLEPWFKVHVGNKWNNNMKGVWVLCRVTRLL